MVLSPSRSIKSVTYKVTSLARDRMTIVKSYKTPVGALLFILKRDKQDGKRRFIVNSLRWINSNSGYLVGV